MTIFTWLDGDYVYPVGSELLARQVSNPYLSQWIVSKLIVDVGKARKDEVAVILGNCFGSIVSDVYYLRRRNIRICDYEKPLPLTVKGTCDNGNTITFTCPQKNEFC
jgi:hypothetical protein